jgi:hypothetical protein
MAESTVQQDLVKALERTVRHLESLHGEDAYGGCVFPIEECTCDLADDYRDVKEAITKAHSPVHAPKPSDPQQWMRDAARECYALKKNYCDARDYAAIIAAHAPQASAPVPEGITPLPWSVSKDGQEVNSDCTNALVADVFDGRPHYTTDKSIARANTAYIVQACNAYPQLLAVAREAERALTRLASPHACGCLPCTGQCVSQESLKITLDAIRDEARAALSNLHAVLPQETEVRK